MNLLKIARLQAAAALAAVALLAFGAAGHAQDKGAPAREADGTWVTPFKAYAPEGGAVLYTGEYLVERKGGMLREIQIYRDAEDKVVHRVESLYDEVNHRPVSYESSDFANNRGSLVRITAKGWDYELRDTQGNVSKSGHYEANKSTYVWPNLVQLVDANWDNVKTGKDLSIELFFSSLGNTIAVQVQADGESTLAGVSGDQFKVSPTNAFIKLAMKPIRLVFANDGTRRLVAFEGRSPVTDANKKNLDLRIVFGPRKTG